MHLSLLLMQTETLSSLISIFGISNGWKCWARSNANRHFLLQSLEVAPKWILYSRSDLEGDKSQQCGFSHPVLCSMLWLRQRHLSMLGFIFWNTVISHPTWHQIIEESEPSHWTSSRFQIVLSELLSRGTLLPGPPRGYLGKWDGKEELTMEWLTWPTEMLLRDGQWAFSSCPRCY